MRRDLFRCCREHILSICHQIEAHTPRFLELDPPVMVAQRIPEKYNERVPSLGDDFRAELIAAVDWIIEGPEVWPNSVDDQR